MYPGTATLKAFSAKNTTPVNFKNNEKLDQDKPRLIPAANISEFPSEYRIQIAVPGLNNDDFRIELKEGQIVISAQKEEEPSGCVRCRNEFDYHNWTRAFILPKDADAILTNATYTNGELSIRIPRTKTAENTASFAVYVY